MKRPVNAAMNPNESPAPLLTDADFENALGPAQDAILPSSGFAESVMAAVDREAAALSPIPFPWLRALPGLVVAAVMIAALAAALASTLLTPAAVSPASGSWQTLLQPLFRSAASIKAFGLLFSAGVVAASLLFCRRLLTAR